MALTARLTALTTRLVADGYTVIVTADGSVTVTDTREYRGGCPYSDADEVLPYHYGRTA